MCAAGRTSRDTVVCVSTETDLHEWRYGSTQAERLCAAILGVEGYKKVDPQAPVGGPDGTKDILVRSEDLLWVAAVFFPPTHQTFTEVRKKFEKDLRGVAANGADGFIFFVNQSLSPGQRATLEGFADTPVEIYHLERMRHMLDTPGGGYAIRREYLRRKMTLEERRAELLGKRRGIGVAVTLAVVLAATAVVVVTSGDGPAGPRLVSTDQLQLRVPGDWGPGAIPTIEGFSVQSAVTARPPAPPGAGLVAGISAASGPALLPKMPFRGELGVRRRRAVVQVPSRRIRTRPSSSRRSHSSPSGDRYR
jgi:hypothetical protein